MRKLRGGLSAVALMLILAIASMGMGLLAFADDNTIGANVDAGGWDMQITRGGVKNDYDGVTHTYTQDGYTKFTNIKSGDKITMNVPVPALRISPDYAVTLPFRLDFKAVLAAEHGDVGNQIGWEMVSVDDSSLKIGGDMTVQDEKLTGRVFGEKQGKHTKQEASVPVMNSGENVSLIVAGVGVAGQDIYYVQNGATLVKVGTIENEISGQAAKLLENGTAGETVDSSVYKQFRDEVSGASAIFGGSLKSKISANFKLTVTSYGTYDELYVKFGEGVIMNFIDENDIGLVSCDNMYSNNLTYTPYKYSGNWAQYFGKVPQFAFAGYETTFILGTNEATSDIPQVKVGGVRVDADNNVDEQLYSGFTGKSKHYGNYKFICPRNTDGKIDIRIAKANYTVTFMNGTQKVAEAYLNNGDLADTTSVESVVIPGKKVVGWYTDNGLQNAYDFDTPVASDLTLYAKCEDVAAIYTHDGTEERFYANVEAGNKITKPVDPEKFAYVFKGWFSDAAFTNEFDFDTTVTQAEKITLYARFDYEIHCYAIGYGGEEQKAIISKAPDSKLTEAEMPSFADITGWPQFSNVKLAWYTDATMSTAVDFGTDGVTVSAPGAFYAAVLDKSLETALGDYMQYDPENGWDQNGNGILDADRISVNRNDSMRGGNDCQYGPNSEIAFTANDDGSATFKLWYIGYIVNAQRLDPAKDIYLTYSLEDTSALFTGEGAVDGGMRMFMIGLFNSYVSALSNQAQMHENNYGVLAELEYQFHQNASLQAQYGVINNQLVYDRTDVDPVTVGGTTLNHVKAGEVTLKISVGDSDTKIYQVVGEGETLIATYAGVTRNLFPNGVILSMQVFREAKITAKVSQAATVGIATDSDGLIDFTVPTDAKSGDKIHFTVNPPAGQVFTDESSLFVDGKQLKVYSDDDGKFFNLPLNASKVGVKFGYRVTLNSGANKIGETVVLSGDKLNRLDVTVGATDVPEGHQFSGWYTDSALTAAYDFGADVTSALTLYAKFEPLTYKFRLADGSSLIDTLDVSYGSKFERPADPTKEGYNFVGWFADEEFTTAFDFEATVTGHATAYAKFEAVAPAEEGGCGSEMAAASVMAASVLLIAAAATAALRRKHAR